MNDPVIPKTFLEAYQCFPQELKKFERFLNDKRLSMPEKTILQGWLKLRDSQYNDLIDSLEKLVCNNPYVEAQRLMLLGISLSNRGTPNLGLSYLEKALSTLPHPYQGKLKTMCSTNLCICLLNLKNKEKLSKILDSIEFYQGITQLEKVEIYRCKFNYAVLIEDNKMATQILKQMNPLIPNMTDGQKSHFFIDQIIYFVKNENFDQCYKILDQMKSIRKFYLSANYNFIKSCLDFITQDKPIYLYPKEFEAFPLLYHQVNCLLSLENQDLIQAKKSWQELQLISPEVYQNEFNYSADKCLFSLVLAKIKNHELNFNFNNHTENKEQALYQLLINNQNKSIPKDKIYELIWGESIENKEDFHKLECIISRLKTKYQVSIQSKKGCYILKTDKKAS
jgi:hypothetical protein